MIGRIPYDGELHTATFGFCLGDSFFEVNTMSNQSGNKEAHDIVEVQQGDSEADKLITKPEVLKLDKWERGDNRSP